MGDDICFANCFRRKMRKMIFSCGLMVIETTGGG